MKPVAKIELADEETTKQVEPLVDRFNEVTNVPILQGRLLEGVVITENKTTKVKHGLNRKLRGWIVVKNNSPIVLHDLQPDNKSEDKELWLFLNTGGDSATFKVNLWVF